MKYFVIVSLLTVKLKMQQKEILLLQDKQKKVFSTLTTTRLNLGGNLSL